MNAAVMQTRGVLPSGHTLVLPKGECVCVGGDLAAHCSIASEQDRLVERKLCFISDASN